MCIRDRGQTEIAVDRTGKERVRIDPRYFRPAEVDCLQGDASFARRKLGWQPTVSFPELVRLMVEADVKLESLAGDESTRQLRGAKS